MKGKVVRGQGSTCKRIAWTAAGRVLVASGLALGAGDAGAELFVAGPGDYRAVLRQLEPGDTLLLRPGTYDQGLPLHGLNGKARRPITIRGRAEGKPPLFIARPSANTVSIVNSSYVTITNLELDGKGVNVDAIKAEGHSRWAHHITIDNVFIHGHGASQQTVAISTKCPAWGWTIENNRILGAGTGLYLGDSDGSAPFVNGVIQYNLIADTRGYNLQVKHQTRAPSPTRPLTIQSTVIRYNVFSKARNASAGRMARPNVLVGDWLWRPNSGYLYLIYGNFFYQNPHEVLFQGEGSLAIYNNVFVNTIGSDTSAVAIQRHHGQPRKVDIFYNTVVASSTGIAIRGGDPKGLQLVAANAVFSNRPIIGGEQVDNKTGGLDVVGRYLENPLAGLGELDLRPVRGKLRGSRMRPKLFGFLPHTDRDFEGNRREESFWGAYGKDADSSGTVLGLDRLDRRDQ